MGTEAREELKAKQLEKVIYFAAYLVTCVDEEQAPRRPAEPRGRARRGDRRDRARPRPRGRAPLQGARDRARRARDRRRQGRRDPGPPARRREGDRARSASAPTPRSTLAKRAFDEFRDLHARKIIEDELLWRELQIRYGEYFEGGMGAEAIARLIDRIDLDEEEVKLREAIDADRRPPSAVGPAQAEGDQAPEDRHGLQPPRRRTAVGSTTRGP